MITLDIITGTKSNKETRSVQLPSVWEDITLQQFMLLLSLKTWDEVSLLHILTGLSKEFILNVPEKSLRDVSKYLFFITEVPDFRTWAKPKHVTIAGKEYKVPTVRAHTFGQKIYLQQEVNRVIENKHNQNEAAPYALAVYFYPIVTGDKEYTEEKILEFIPTVMQMRATDAIPTADFFLRSYLKSLKKKERHSLLNLLKNKRTQELNHLTSTE